MAWLGPLTDLDLHRGSAAQVFGRHAEAARRHLAVDMVSVPVHVGMKAALPRAGQDVELLRSHEQRLLSIEGHGAQGHVAEHEGHVHRHQRPRTPEQAAAVVQPHPAGAAAHESDGLDRFPKRVDGRIGDLRRVKNDVVEYHVVGKVGAAGGQQHAPRTGLGDYAFPDAAGERRMRRHLRRCMPHLDGRGGAHLHAPHAGYAAAIGHDASLLLNERIEGAFLDASAAANAVLGDEREEPVAKDAALPLGSAHRSITPKGGSMPRRTMPSPTLAIMGEPGSASQVSALSCTERIAHSSLAA